MKRVLQKDTTMDTNQDSEDFVPRSYQIEILEAAKKENTIACLGTGTGKTFIAVMLIREFANDVRLPYKENGKRIFFIVPTVELVHQQAEAIKEHTDLIVKHFYGEMNVDTWNKDMWINEFVDGEVLVMTAEIFKNIVQHTFIPYNKIRLIIFDECHQAQGNHPYSEAMKCFTNLNERELPRIFGLSASLINGKCKPTQLEKQLKDLQKTLRSSITTVSDVINIQKYVADPDEYIIGYMPFEIETILLSKIKQLKNEIKCRKKNLGRGNENLPETELNFFDTPLKCLKALESTLENLGFWCAQKAAEVFKGEVSKVLNKQILNKFFNEEKQEALEKLNTFLHDFINECIKINFGFTRDDLDDKDKFPNKLRRLLDIFLSIKRSKKFLKKSAPNMTVSFDDDPENYHQMLKEENSSDIQVCSIIFVKERITAYVLQQWILAIRCILPELSFLNPEYIVGHGTNGVKKISMSVKSQKNILFDFRQKKCNVLISTSVLEEGMDVQQCNLVIRFDLPDDFRGYVQSKGRARAKNSIYILMSEAGEKHTEFINDMCCYKTIEMMLLEKCRNRTVPDEDDIREFMEDHVIPPYMPYGESGPRITSTSAISLINRYCATLPSDMASKLHAKWRIDTDPDSPSPEFECTLKMPINSPLKAPIVGPKMPSKKRAKQAAALKACMCLDDEGELNEHLVPVSSKLQNTIEEELGPLEEEDGKDAIPGTKKRKQIYDKHVPVFFQDSQPQPLIESYLHILDMKLIEPLPKELNPRNRPIKDPDDFHQNLGILVSKKLPEVNSFPIFTKVGKVKVSVSLCDKTFILSKDELQIIKDFHRFVFSNALHLEENKMFDPRSSKMQFYVVPVNRNDTSSWIDWSFMKTVKESLFNDLVKKTSKTVSHTVYPEELFKDAVLLKSYKIEREKPTYHHFICITDKKPSSTCDFTGPYMNFKEYYKHKYGIEIQNDEQHLVETFTNKAYVSIKEKLTNSKTMSKTEERRKNYHEYLIPELCIIHPFPSPLFLKVQYLPTVLFRLYSFLLAEEIRQNIVSYGLIGTVNLPQNHHWPYFDLGTSDKDLKKHLSKLGYVNSIPANFPRENIEKSGDKITNFTCDVNLNNHPGPSPSLILQALTSKSADDEFDLERLEMIGDSFLKYVISVKMYIKYPNFDEGKLTKLRSRLIQNLHLYQLAKKKNLGEFLNCTAFSCEKTWLPPCYTIHEKVDERVLDNKADPEEQSKLTYQFFTKQIISDKCIADAVEALIGTYLLSCGQKGALMFMHWIGLNPLPNKNDSEEIRENFINWPPVHKLPNVIVGEIQNVEERLTELTGGLDRFESIINYKFKNKALLLQAFTHPSCDRNDITDCYQRLEYLGDAVLDFLITRQLFEDPHDLSPGSLTDLRSALVNNKYFASLAVKYEYHKHRRMFCWELNGLLDKFLKIFTHSEYFTFFKEYGYALEETECFELDEIEVPKFLGDLFESVAGAIYLDSGMSLNAVWEVYYPMLEPAIRYFSQDIPKSPVRQLYEVLGKKDVFSKIANRGEKTYVIVELPNSKEIVGVGPNKKVAKRSAAKRALAELRKERDKKEMLNTNSRRVATNAITGEGEERPKKKFKNVDLEKDGMNIKKVKENKSSEADFNMTEKNKEEISDHVKEVAEDEESPKKNGCSAEIETKEWNKPIKDRKIKNGTEKNDITSEYGEKTLEPTETGLKREIEQLENSTAEVCPKKAKYEKEDKLIKEGKSM